MTKGSVFAALLLAVAVLAIASLGWGDDPNVSPAQVTADGLHNVLRLSPQIYSGAGPEGDKSFAAIERLGVKTVISVDGAKPDIEGAKRHGLRYVHIPIGYHGVLREQALRIAQAVRELPGPFYIHCHHGKHRGPTAAAIARLCLDDRCRVEEALAVLQSAGTDPRYLGLFQSVRTFERPTAAELAKLPRELPETVVAVGLTQAMVAVDHAWDNLKLVRGAGWRTPADHPDMTPAHEALQLLEAYQELLRLPELGKRPDDFRRWATEGHAGAEQLETLLRTADAKLTSKSLEMAERLYLSDESICAKCHAKYRDVR